MLRVFSSWLVFFGLVGVSSGAFKRQEMLDYCYAKTHTVDVFKSFVHSNDTPLVFLPPPVSAIGAPLDVAKLEASVVELAVVAHRPLAFEVVNEGTGFAVEVQGEVYIATCLHNVACFSPENRRLSILIKNKDGRLDHVQAIGRLDEASDFVLMKPSRHHYGTVPFSAKNPAPLERVLVVGRVGDYLRIPRSGEVLRIDDDGERQEMLISCLASRGSSGSPVFSMQGEVVGIVSSVKPLLRPTEIYRGDHFSEAVLVHCFLIPFVDQTDQR